MLSYAMTVHRAQGLTLPAVNFQAAGLFTNGQLYVGVSRTAGLETQQFSGDLNLDVPLAAAEVVDFERGHNMA